MPGHREGTFEPRLISKHERRFTGFDDKILALYARGMTVRDIQGILAEMYAVEVSHDLISTATDGDRRGGDRVAKPAARADVSGGRSSSRCASRFATRRRCRSKAIYVALAVLPDGDAATSLGLWIEQTEGAKFRMKVFTRPENVAAARTSCRGRPMASTGMSDALAAVFPDDDAADVHRASDSPQPRLRELA